MKIVYIAGPYRAATEQGIQDNIDRAEAYAIKYWLKGYAVFCPHKNSSHLDGLVPDKNFLNADKEFIKRCVDIMVMTPGWKKSDGSVGEHKLAIELGLKIIYETLS